MALLGKIRGQFGWLMMGLVFLGVGGFLFMDVSGPGGGGPGRDSVVVGAVNGQEITRTDMQGYTEDLQGGRFLPEESRNIAWEQLLQEALITQETNAVGLAVTSKEMGDLFIGENISPMVRQQFMDPNTGQFNPQNVRDRLDFFENLEYDQYPEAQLEQIRDMEVAWGKLQKRVQFDRLSSKYLAMLQRGVYTPNWLTDSEYNRNGQTYNMQYVKVPYSAISNTEVTVSEEEMKQYIKENAKKYDREAGVAIEFVKFPVKATSADSAKYKTDMEKLAAEFRTSEDDSLFLFQNDGVIDPLFYTKEELTEPLEIKDSLYSMDKGGVIGPFITNNHFKVIKILDRKVMPDSVRSRHVLRRSKNQQGQDRPQQEMAQEYQLLDSLRKAINAGEVSFDSVAAKYGTDATNTKGGDLGFQAKDGSFIKEFESFLFYTGEKDSLEIIQTQFGLHLVQITDEYFEKNEAGLRIGYFSMPIIPSETTTKDVRLEANNFVANNRDLAAFQAAAVSLNLEKGEAAGLPLNGFEIPGLSKSSSSAEIIKWAHMEAEKGAVAGLPYAYDDPNLNYTKEFVVPVMVSKTTKGLADLSDPSVEKEVKRILQNKKKAEKIKANIQNAASLKEIADKYSLQVETTTNPVSYGSARINPLGGAPEPKVVAVAAISEPNQLSKPIEGNEGVYVISLMLKNDPPAYSAIEIARRQVSQASMQIISSTIFEALKDKATIEDNRANMY